MYSEQSMERAHALTNRITRIFATIPKQDVQIEHVIRNYNNAVRPHIPPLNKKTRVCSVCMYFLTSSTHKTECVPLIRARLPRNAIVLDPV